MMRNKGKVLALKELLFQWGSRLALMKPPNFNPPCVNVSAAIHTAAAAAAVLAEKSLLAPYKSFNSLLAQCEFY